MICGRRSPNGEYFVTSKTGILHIEGMFKESAQRPYDIEPFEDEGEIRGQYHRLYKNCVKKSASLKRASQGDWAYWPR